EVGTDHAEAIAFLSREHARTLLLATCKFQLRCLECGQTLLPRALQATRHQPVVGIDGAIATLGEACCIARPLDAEPPVLERGRDARSWRGPAGVRCLLSRHHRLCAALVGCSVRCAAGWPHMSASRCNLDDAP